MDYNIQLGDTLQLIKTITDNSIDCIITDPPYEVISGGTPDNKDVQRPSGMLSKNDGKIFQYNDIDITNWIDDCYRILKPNTHIYIMTNFFNLEHYMQSIRKAGFDIHNLLIWEKNNATPNRWYMKNCEYIIFARKGESKPINDCGCKTVLQFDNVRNKLHPTEKPIPLLKTLITNSTNENDIVFDPFGGSFSTVLAAIQCGRKAISFELDEKYFNLGKERLENIKPEDIIIPVKTAARLTPNQQLILDILKNNPTKDFSGAELSVITGLPTRTCSGCITPLCSNGYAHKTNNSSPFRIQYN